MTKEKALELCRLSVEDAFQSLVEDPSLWTDITATLSRVAELEAAPAWERRLVADMQRDSAAGALAKRLVTVEAERDALKAENARLRRRLKGEWDGQDTLAQIGSDLMRENAQLKAAVEWRPRPPTEAEVQAHGGPWLVKNREFGHLEIAEPTPSEAGDINPKLPESWRPIDAEGMPVAWPVVEE